MSEEDKKIEHDAMIRSYYDIPMEKDLRVMSDVSLAEMISFSEEGSPKYRTLQKEIERRKAINTQAEKTDKAWYEKPIGQIGIAVTGTILSALAIYLIGGYLGISI